MQMFHTIFAGVAIPVGTLGAAMSWKARVEQLESMVSCRTPVLALARRQAFRLRIGCRPSAPTSMEWQHLAHIRENLDRVTAGEIQNLMIFCPLRHRKSE